ncbi:hypothetical protein VP249E411_P0069 [Vibrio phage 249E41-1]|nr:hypothetical protein VP249E411_P0069 [Vibrio phage 249E41-1]CAH9012802.1 hypothetical protein VP495E541_P0066 [Vibrio phage 495E54-1]CAH9012855.1 hypothetical protein VP277E431_P0056 [Vibrio phage 277E43-1]CAH9012991.1 hypothetical protein VP496E541_P0066 [Vibrio phage 496E54-1]CAH9016712.1 hypothetical protein VP193E371_P0067 [Vibrio phage 193E37-1]
MLRLIAKILKRSTWGSFTQRHTVNGRGSR